MPEDPRNYVDAYRETTVLPPEEVRLIALEEEVALLHAEVNRLRARMETHER